MADLDGKDIMFKFPPTFASTHTALVLKTPKTKTSVRKVFLPKTVAEMLVQRKADIEELAKFSKEYPQFCRLKEKNKYGGRIYLVDKFRLSIHLQPPYSKERIETVTQNLLKRTEDTDE